jgi:uncharacterized protein YdaU (DUF1376 family)
VSLQPEGTMAFMPFYFERFAWSTRAWPPEACWAYLMLLCEQYTAGRLPVDPQVLDRISPGTLKHWDLIEPKIPVCDDGYRRNGRCVEHRVKTLELAAKRREAARTAAAARYACEPDAPRMPNACDTDAPRMPSGSEAGSGSESLIGSAERSKTISLNGSAVEPDSSVNDPKPNRRPTIQQSELEALWLKFPRKVGKKRAMALLDKGVREIMDDIEHDDPTDALIYMGERIDALAHKHRTTDPKYVPHPATWLGQGRYLDPVETP